MQRYLQSTFRNATFEPAQFVRSGKRINRVGQEQTVPQGRLKIYILSQIRRFVFPARQRGPFVARIILILLPQ